MSDIDYVKLIANSNPIKVISLQLKEKYRFFDEFSDHYYIEKLDFFLLWLNIYLKQICKRIVKDFISLHMQTLPLKCSPEISDKNDIALVWKLRLWTYIWSISTLYTSKFVYN